MEALRNAAVARPRARAWLRRTSARLFEPVDVAALATFRIMFGLLMLWEVWRYFDKGRIARYYMDPQFLFKYYGFEWVHPWPGNGMLVQFWALGVLALLITLGWCYRVAMSLFFLGFTYVFLLDQAQYLNHFYLVSLVAFLMCFLPAARGWSLDAWFHKRADPWVPRWTHWVLLLQFEVMYIFAGLVKVNGDWLRLEPLRSWLRSRADEVWFGAIFQHDWVIAVGAYGSILLHLVGAPLLLWGPARPYVFALYVLFHLSNHTLFNIGIFPWLAIVGTLLFFGPAWPRGLLGFLSRGNGASHRWPILSPPPPLAYVPPGVAVRGAVLTLVARWALLQVAVPLRHYLYPGSVSWHEQGHRFAWQMKLRQTRGAARFIIKDPRTGETWTVDPVEHLSSKQARYMAAHPDMVLQFAHHLGRRWQEEYGVPAPEVRVEGWKSLNGREPEPLVDPDCDLMEVPRNLRNADWILPMSAPLPPRVTPGGGGGVRGLRRVRPSSAKVARRPARSRAYSTRDSRSEENTAALSRLNREERVPSAASTCMHSAPWYSRVPGFRTMPSSRSSPWARTSSTSGPPARASINSNPPTASLVRLCRTYMVQKGQSPSYISHAPGRAWTIRGTGFGVARVFTISSGSGGSWRPWSVGRTLRVTPAFPSCNSPITGRELRSAFMHASEAPHRLPGGNPDVSARSD